MMSGVLKSRIMNPNLKMWRRKMVILTSSKNLFLAARPSALKVGKRVDVLKEISTKASEEKASDEG